jgi:hypothetical protein
MIGRMRSAVAMAILAAPAWTWGAEAKRSPHFYRFGILASTNAYQDTTLKKGLISGNYRPYGQYSFDEKYSVMVRGNLFLKHFPEKPAGVDRQFNAVGILEITSFEARLGNHTVYAGRGYYQTEQGILFANFADGISYTGDYRFGNFKAMALYSADYGKSLCAINITGCGGEPNPFNTIPGLQPDASVTGSGQRIFATLEYTTPQGNFGPVNTRGTVYGVYSRDLIKESASVVTRYEYNPHYAGIGTLGYLGNSRLQYRLDAIYQGGNAFNQTRNGESLQATIFAAAGLARVNYYLPVLQSVDPQLSGEAAMGSGDGDAARAGTASQSNTSGTYTAFQAFGAYSGGLALKPRLTNMQIYRLGIMARPFKVWYATRNISLQLKYSLYRKNAASGGISDSAATESSTDVGMAGDAALTFAVTTDVQFFYGFGLFKPGAAYPVTAADGSDGRALRQAHIVSLTLVF